MFQAFLGIVVNSQILLPISPRFPIIYGQVVFLTPCPGLLCTRKKAYLIVHVIKNFLEND